MTKDLAEEKRNIYKDLSKTVDRYKHLPKLKYNHKEFAVEPTDQYQSLDYHDQSR